MVTIACILLYVLINYGYVMGRYRRSSKQVQAISLTPSATRAFTILVPFRNEEKRLLLLLDSMSQLTYPHEQLHFIFINDASTDDSVELIQRWRFQNGTIPVTIIDNVPNARSPKKEAIQLAMGIVKTDWVITTDADCAFSPTHFNYLDSYLSTHTDVQAVAGGVRLIPENGLAYQFDRLDQLSLQGLTLSSFQKGDYLLNNAANWAFTKSAFQQIGGHRSHTQYASGDDIFMLHQLKAHQIKVGYLVNEEYAVETWGAKSWGQLLTQRIRWASKSAAYKNPKIADLGYSTFLANLALVAAWICTAITPLFGLALLGLYVYKFWIDYPILRVAVQQKLGTWPITTLFGILFYPIWTSFVAILSLAKIGYTWKGRRFSV